MSTEASLARLRDPADAALAGLARLVAEEVLQRPAGAIFRPEALAPPLVSALRSAAEARPREALIARAERLAATARTIDRPLRSWVPTELHDAMSTTLGMPWVPSESLAYEVLNHDAMRTLLREVLQSTLQRFAQGVRAVDDGALGGLAGRVAKRGRGLFGGAAEGVLGAVQKEIESAFEGRMRDFLGGAVDEAVRGVARWIADPRHADLVSGFRVSVLDVLLDVPVRELVSELGDADPAAPIDAVLDALAVTAARPDLEDTVRHALTSAIDALGDETLGDVADELGLREGMLDSVVQVATELLREVVATEAFAAWWRDLHS